MATQFPQWIRRPWASGDAFEETRRVLADLGLATVCQSARCPNQGECWQRRAATLMLLGSACTRRCRFCAVKEGPAPPPDPAEPWKVAQAVRRLGLAHVVMTSVTRDDLPDGGAKHFANTIRAVRSVNPETTIEVLTPDFQGSRTAIATVLESEPGIFGHNIETVRRLHPLLRDPRCDYDRSLEVLRIAAELSPDVTVKSGLMVGHGETEEEVIETLRDLCTARCAAVSIGQYLRPAPRNCAVAEFVPPETFNVYKRLANELGFLNAEVGPFVRSSYHSDPWRRA